MGKYKGIIVEFEKQIHLQNVMAELDENDGILVTSVDQYIKAKNGLKTGNRISIDAQSRSQETLVI